MTSLWLDRPLVASQDPWPQDGTTDVVVVGAGITGLTTALLLARSGRRVTVVEARHVGAVTTGRTTGKVSLLQGTKLSTLLRHQSRRVARAYVEANDEGLQWLLRFAHDHGVPVQRRDAVTFAASSDELSTARDEHDAARSLGLDVTWLDDLDVPFPHVGGTVLADQAQLDPMDLLDALAGQLRSHGGTIHEGRRVRHVSKVGRPRVTLDDGTEIRADHVVLATGTPILDRGLYFAKLEPMRSYIVAFEGVDVPTGMYLSAGSSSVSVRDAPLPDGSTGLLVGGGGHVVGRARSEAASVDHLRHWTARFFPGAVETHAWSAQDYGSHDGVPYMGRMPRGGGRVWVATGYEKWGMTNGIAAALSLAAQILGSGPPSWGKVLNRRVTGPRGAAQVLKINAGVGAAALAGFAKVGLRSAPSAPPEGQGSVGRDGVVPTGTSTVDGRTCSVVALCTHLGGALEWNDAERSYDCPLHGSRFGPGGEVLEGPATRPLALRDATD